MSDLAITDFIPKTSDSEKNLLQRLLAHQVAAGTGVDVGSLSTALASASRTATTSTSDISSGGKRGLLVYLECTTSDATLTLNLGVGIQINSQPFVICTSGTFVVSSVIQRMLILHPSYDTAAVTMPGYSWSGNLVRATLPANFRLAVVHSNANAITYSLKYALID